MEITFSPDIQKKLLAKHKVLREEVEQCFYNRRGKLLEDSREEHKTTPPTQWFIAETDKRRKLKVIFVLDGDVRVKSAYDADEESIRIYKKHAF
ncbi:MAG: ADP-ribosyl-(dinitrogen reductase) hydrolase [Gammaproteobacteria bacterium]|nr:ADP-ribosyl-(dinitrogen reductase) hydrolase [Gammaproteobacteria bacterium]